MKCMVILCVVLLVFSVVVAKKKSQNTEEKSMKQAIKQCQKDPATHVKGGILRKIKKQRQVELPENYGDHIFCVFKGVGIFNEDNTVNIENLRKRITNHADPLQDIEEIVSECQESQQDLKSTALHINKCLLKHQYYV